MVKEVEWLPKDVRASLGLFAIFVMVMSISPVFSTPFPRLTPLAPCSPHQVIVQVALFSVDIVKGVVALIFAPLIPYFLPMVGSPLPNLHSLTQSVPARPVTHGHKFSQITNDLYSWKVRFLIYEAQC